ncbi:MAG: zinc-binding dehydrogenase, partial [Betaproteobacteria bacterium]|nr:zinc-binding dehydrogenase [Betaproteobacteria bacterium]
TGAGTVLNTLRVPKGASVAVFGTGGVGLAAVMAARIAGASPIVAVDVVPARLALARELGATHALDNRRGERAARVATIAPRGVDSVLEITGEPAMERIGAAVLAPRGTLALVARPNRNARLPGGRRRMSVIQGDSLPQRFIPRLVALWRSDRFPIERLVRIYPFGAINRAMADVRRGRTIKPVLRMGLT